MSFSSKALSTPMCAMPLAAPPPSAMPTLELNRFHSNKYELLQLVYTSSVYFDSFASLLYREKGSATWNQVDHGTVSSKAFHYPDDIEFIDDDQFETTLCIEDCHWWGKYADARINLRDRTIAMSKNPSTEEEY